ncbi:MAG: glycosyltransferase [Flavobacteriales bacterium]|nr:glycosyltransferase [Flavobacteriales bacterium]
MSYDGLTDPLGQSQILPYLKGLSARGYSFTIISFEKPDAFSKRKNLIQKICDETKIDWRPLNYTKTPPVLSTIYDLSRMNSRASSVIRSADYQLVHVRSYIPALVALRVKRRFGIPFIFDKRGFWIEERVEGEIWNPNNPLLAIVMQYFKKKERKFFIESEAVVSLTESAVEAICRQQVIKMTGRELKEFKEKTFVIPCAADQNLFSFVSSDERKRAKEKIGISPDNPVFVYLGSVGTWYLLQEILESYRALREVLPELWFFIFTGGDKESILRLAAQLNVPTDRMKIEFVHRENLPDKLKLADFSINYMRPGYSRMATSPVKIGELLSMGVPFIVNSGVGDSESQITTLGAGMVTKPFPDEESYKILCENYSTLFEVNREDVANQAREVFSLKNAIKKYEKVYQYALKR